MPFLLVFNFDSFGFVALYKQLAYLRLQNAALKSFFFLIRVSCKVSAA